jgi:hypothetical protein
MGQTLGNTFQEICNIIQQMHPVLNPQAIENNYHLVDPDGNVIFPRLWDAIMRDDLIITMRLKMPTAIAPGMWLDPGHRISELIDLLAEIPELQAQVQQVLQQVQELQPQVQQVQQQVQELQRLHRQVQELQRLRPQVQQVQQQIKELQQLQPQVQLQAQELQQVQHQVQQQAQELQPRVERLEQRVNQKCISILMIFYNLGTDANWFQRIRP